MSDTIVHIAGLDVQIGQRLRQRCGWCGAVILDEDLTRIAVQIPEGKTAEQARADGDLDLPTWKVGALIEVGGGVRSIIEHNDGDRIPPNSCGALDYEVTR